MFYITGVIADGSFTLREQIFYLFRSCDLELDPMIFVYELDQYSMEIYWMCKYELPTLRFSKVIVSDRQTDRHADIRPKL